MKVGVFFIETPCIT